MTDRNEQPSPAGDSTRAVHGGRSERAGPVAPPIVQTSTFAFADHDAMLAAFHAKERGTVYTRYTNPTLEECERRLAALEGGEAALVFGSGMAAIVSAILAGARAGDGVLVQREIYGGTHEFLTALAPRFGIEVDWYAVGDEDAFRAGLARKPAVVYLESPTNPVLRCVDVRAAAAAARAAGATSVIDNTFASPVNQRPLALGVDLVVHSATKYLAGHSDLVAGAVVGSRERLREVWRFRKLLGGVLDPHGAWLLERSMRTLAVRVERHNANGVAVARYLATHPAVETVHYPGLPEHPDHAIAARQMRGFGGMVTVTLAADLAGTIRFVEGLRLFRLAASLGGVESLVSIPATSSHFALSPEERRAAGVPDGMVRLSLGIEDADDLVRDLEQALARLPAPARA